MSGETWQQLRRRLLRCISPERAQREFEWALDGWEHNARGRIVRALVSGMHAETRYEMDATFHLSIDTIAAIAEAAVFNDHELTRQEAEHRRVQFELLQIVEPFESFPLL